MPPGVAESWKGMPIIWIGPKAGVLEVDDVVVGFDLGVVGQLVDALHRREDEVSCLAQDFDPFGQRLLLERRRQSRDRLPRVGHT